MRSPSIRVCVEGYDGSTGVSRQIGIRVVHHPMSVTRNHTKTFLPPGCVWGFKLASWIVHCYLWLKYARPQVGLVSSDFWWRIKQLFIMPHWTVDILYHTETAGLQIRAFSLSNYRHGQHLAIGNLAPIHSFILQTSRQPATCLDGCKLVLRRARARRKTMSAV